jgi:hypothetical protein
MGSGDKGGSTVAKTGGNNSTTAAYDPRQIWATNLAPLVVAAREGAAHAARTASRERARVRRQPAWWQQRWVIVTTGGLAVLGAAGGVYAVLASRRSRTSRHAADSTGGGLGAQADGFRSTESGRAKVSDLARNVVHKLRRGEPEPMPGEASSMPQPAAMPGDRQPEGGYHGQP